MRRSGPPGSGGPMITAWTSRTCRTTGSGMHRSTRRRSDRTCHPVGMGTDHSEQVAFEVIRRVTGTQIDLYDTDGRQGAVDGVGRDRAGRQLAVEVTRTGDQSRMHVEGQLSRDLFEWSNPGAWFWSMTVGVPSDIEPLRARYMALIATCETEGIVRPDWRHDTVSEELRWLSQSSVAMFGHPDLPTAEKYRNVSVMPEGGGGGVDEELSGLLAALSGLFDGDHLRRKFDKLARHQADERHLFLGIDMDGVPFSVLDGLAFGSSLPTDPPPLPDPITHLWIAPRIGRRVLYWSPAGWTQHHPYDDEAESS